MKSFIIVSVVLAVIAFAAGNSEDPCYGVRDGIFVDNPESCSAYFACSEGKGTAGVCPAPFYFNFLKQTCDWPENVDCEDQIITEPQPTDTEPNTPTYSTDTTTVETTTTEGQTEIGSTGTQTEEQTEEPTESTDEETTTEAVTEAPSVCYGLDNGILVGSAGDCVSFFHCVDNSAFPNTCPSGLLFNGVYCDFEDRVKCLDETTTETTTTLGVTTTTEAEIECPIDPEAICFGKPDGTFLNNLETCPSFYYCKDDSHYAGVCPPPFYFNPITSTCDWPHEVDCSDETATITSTITSTTTESPGSPETSTENLVTDTQTPETQETTRETQATTTEPSVTEPEPLLCLPGDAALHPHPTNCSLSLLCFNGQVFVLPCNDGEHFSSEINGCAPREQANCRLEDPVCDPIESENQAIYSPHPHFCDQFFVCFRGELLGLSCNAGDHWIQYKKSCVAASESQCIE